MPSTKNISDLAAITLWIRQKAKEVVENPTLSMQATFESLTSAQQWALFSMLNFDQSEVEIEELKKSYELLCPAESVQPFSIVISHMTEAFLTIRDQQMVDWIHPTCRDLAIENLAKNHVGRRNFLSLCSLDGLQIALSFGGGSSGAITAPLLSANNDWKSLTGNQSWITDRSSLIVLAGYPLQLRDYDSWH